MGAMTGVPARRYPPGRMTAYNPTTVRADDPTLRERAIGYMTRMTGDNRAANDFWERVLGGGGPDGSRMGLVDLTPAGVPLFAEEAGRKLATPGRRVEGAVDTALAVLPIPGAVKNAAGRAVLREGERVAERLMTRPAEGVAKRGILATPDLRTLSRDEAVAAARGQPHLIRAPDGTYVGGPADVIGARQLGAARKRFDADVAEGAPAADWYGRARAFNEQVAGPVPARQRLAAQEQALFSAQANPDTNLNFALQAHNGYEAGKPYEIVRTGQQAQTYRTARDAGREIPLGPKTGIYGQHLDPTQPPATTGTNDIWHARAFGYTDAKGQPFSRALTPQEHRFIDYETMLAVDRANRAAAGGRTNWTAAEVQAAPWVAGKGRQVGMEEAAKTYPDFADKYTAFGTYEAQPGVMTGHLPDMATASSADRAAYAADPRSSWADPTGRDVAYDAVGAYQRPTQSATGIYTPPGGAPENNPASVARPLVGVRGGEVDPASREIMDAVEGTRAYVDAQGAGAWSKPIVNADPKEAGAVFLPNEGPLTIEQIAQLQARGGAEGIGDVVDTGQGAILTSFDFSGDVPRASQGAVTSKALRSGLGSDLTTVTGAEPRRIKMDGGYMGLEDQWSAGEGSGAATRQLEEWLSNPAILDKLDASPAVRAKALGNLARDEEVAAATGQALRPDIQRARQIIGEQGFKGLFAALKRGELLPALILPALGLDAALQADQRTSPPGA